MYPKHVKISQAHDSAKVQKEFERIPPLRPIVNTIRSTYYGVGKNSFKILNTLNQHNLKYFFDAVEKSNLSLISSPICIVRCKFTIH